jgi:prevent-host-death family protein
VIGVFARNVLVNEGGESMSVTITVDEAQAKLKDLIHQLVPGDEIIITENTQPVARLMSEPTKVAKPRPAPGLGKGSIVYMAPDFDAPLDEFKEYME